MPFCCMFTITACLHLAVQGKGNIVFNYGIFYILLGLLLYAIQYRGLHMLIFSEFYVLMFWKLSPVILLSWDLITTPPGKISSFLSKSHIPTPVILGVLVVSANSVLKERSDVKLSEQEVAQLNAQIEELMAKFKEDASELKAKNDVQNVEVTEVEVGDRRAHV